MRADLGAVKQLSARAARSGGRAEGGVTPTVCITSARGSTWCCVVEEVGSLDRCLCRTEKLIALKPAVCALLRNKHAAGVVQPAASSRVDGAVEEVVRGGSPKQLLQKFCAARCRQDLWHRALRWQLDLLWPLVPAEVTTGHALARRHRQKGVGLLPRLAAGQATATLIPALCAHFALRLAPVGTRVRWVWATAKREHSLESAPVAPGT